MHRLVTLVLGGSLDPLAIGFRGGGENLESHLVEELMSTLEDRMEFRCPRKHASSSNDIYMARRFRLKDRKQSVDSEIYQSESAR